MKETEGKLGKLTKVTIVAVLSIAIFCIAVLTARNIGDINAVLQEYDGVLKFADLVFVFISLGSIIFLYIQIKAEHEKGRREKAIELLLTWAKEITCETKAAKKIVEKFNVEQCRKLMHEEEFKVDCKAYNEIVAIFKKEEKKEQSTNNENKNDTQITLDIKTVKELRWQVINFLNILESILVAWQYNVADREIIIQEMSYLVSPKDGKNVLEQFRVAAGSEEAFPAIEIFCDYMENERKKKLKEKAKII